MRHGSRALPLLLLALPCTFARADHPAEDGFVDADGVRLNWHGYGEGPPLLVLNGGPGVSSMHFAMLARSLADEAGPRRVILFDQGLGSCSCFHLLAFVGRETVTFVVFMLVFVIMLFILYHTCLPALDAL